MTRLVLEVAREYADEGALPDADAPLAGEALESLTLVEFIVDLETRLNLTLPAEALDEATFRTPRTVAAALLRLSDGG